MTRIAPVVSPVGTGYPPLPPGQLHQEQHMMTTKTIDAANDPHTFQCCPDENGTLFLYFGIGRNEYIFENFSREQILSMKSACERFLARAPWLANEDEIWQSKIDLMGQ